MGLAGAHFARLRAWDRPRFALHPAYRRGFAPARRVVLATGLVLTARASPVAFTLVTLLLLALWGRLAWVRSELRTRWILDRELRRARAISPGAREPDLLYEVLARRHPEWGDELLRRIVEDHPSTAGLARTIVRIRELQ
jgi:hypothetical protein